MKVDMVRPLCRLRIHGNRVKLAMSHARLRHHVLCEFRHRRGWTAQDHGFQTIVVVEVGVHRCDRHIMMVVLHARQARRQLAFMMVIYVAECPDAVFGGAAYQFLLAECLTDEVAESFRTVLIALFPNQAIEGLGKVVINRNGEALHRRALLSEWLQHTVRDSSVTVLPAWRAPSNLA